MIYRETLVMRKALAWFAGVLFAVIVIGFVSRAIHIGSIGPEDAGIDVISGWLTAIFASIFGVALGNGSQHAARILWMLPAARWKLALKVVAVDLAGTTVAYVYTYVAILSCFALNGRHVRADIIGPAQASGIVMALAMAYATYGWSALVGMLGRRVPYCGVIALPALIIWMGLAQAPLLRGTSIANPFVVFNAGLDIEIWERHHSALDPLTSSLQWLGTSWDTPVLFAIALGTSGLAVALWQRAEAIH